MSIKIKEPRVWREFKISKRGHSNFYIKAQFFRKTDASLARKTLTGFFFWVNLPTYF